MINYWEWKLIVSLRCTVRNSQLISSFENELLLISKDFSWLVNTLELHCTDFSKSEKWILGFGLFFKAEKHVGENALRNLRHDKRYAWFTVFTYHSKKFCERIMKYKFSKEYLKVDNWDFYIFWRNMCKFLKGKNEKFILKKYFFY